MNSTKRLRSVTHSIAHHGVSGLCHLHPHLGDACEDANLESYQLSLLTVSEVSQFEKDIKEIDLSTKELRKRFAEILTSEDLDVSELSEALITYRFFNSPWPCGCQVIVRTNANQVIDVKVDLMGNPVAKIQK